MLDTFMLFLHALVIIVRLIRLSGLLSFVAQSVLLQLHILIFNRCPKRAPNLRSLYRIIAGLCTLLMRPTRVLLSAIVLTPSSLLHFHKSVDVHQATTAIRLGGFNLTRMSEIFVF